MAWERQETDMMLSMLVPCTCHDNDMLLFQWYCNGIALVLPCYCHVVMPCYCHFLPCYCYVISVITPCYHNGIPILLHWYCNVVAMIMTCFAIWLTLQFHCIAIALPRHYCTCIVALFVWQCYCDDIAMIWPWHGSVIAMILPRYCHDIARGCRVIAMVCQCYYNGITMGSLCVPLVFH